MRKWYVIIFSERRATIAFFHAMFAGSLVPEVLLFLYFLLYSILRRVVAQIQNSIFGISLWNFLGVGLGSLGQHVKIIHRCLSYHKLANSWGL